MKILQKYYKQKLSKSDLKHYQAISDEYKLSLNPKNSLDLLKISVFETSLQNKTFFEQQFETIRSSNIDMWDNLSFNERNFIIKCDIASNKVKRVHFKVDGENIYIPFFDKLLNKLYDDETAILELPQFFKLYKDFKSKLVPLESYGLLPYIANMSRAKCIAHNDTYVVLFDKELACFYKMNLNECIHYPILQNIDFPDEYILKSSKELLKDETKFLNTLIENKMINEKSIKKIKKYREKGKEIQ